MKKIKLKNELLPFNTARQKSFNSLCITLEKLYGKQNICEKDFKNEWYNNLTKEEKQEISKARKFINENSNWDFIEGMQFTIEPQLILIINTKSPQISQHYLVKKDNGKFIICKDIDGILEKYKLINE